MLRTPLCNRLGIRYPILSVGMGAMAGPELAAAVSNAGACGVVGRVSGAPASDFGARIRQVRALTDKPFGANVILATAQQGYVEACLEERVPLLVLFWGDARPYVADAHRRGVRVFLQVGSVEEAVAAADAGVDGIIAQGMEAGGHVRSTTALSVLLPAIVEAVPRVPVLASGGVATGAGIVAALGLGAQGVSLGTRFLCSQEAHAAEDYKARVVRSTASDTVYTSLFDGGWTDAPHRVLRNKAVSEWEAAGRPPTGRRPAEGSVVGTVRRGAETVELIRYSARSYPLPDFRGDIEYCVLYAGESCSLVGDVKPAAVIVRDLVTEAEAALAALPR